MDGGIINLPNSSSSSSIDTVSILVVDDDITCLAIVSAILKKFNYQVVTVKHPKDALCTLRIKGGAFDLVVSDVHMPDMNGFELQQAIAQEFNDLPVVLMSADDKEGVVLKGLECGAAYFIMKPVSPDDLRDLWQFAVMKRKNHQNIVIKEIPQQNNWVEEVAHDVSASSVNEDDTKKKESKRKNPRKEGSDEERNGENSQSCSQKRPKIVWTNSLHNRFLEAIRSIGLDRAVPKKILEVMNVPGLTRENVASHLQKYRIFLRRVSDASYKIQFSSHKGLSRNFIKSSGGESSRTGPQSTLMLNRLSKLSYQIQNRGQFHALPNLEASSSSIQPGQGQSRLLFNSGSWQKPPCILANISLEDHYSNIATSASLDAFPCNTGHTYEAPASHKNDVVSSLMSLKNLSYQTNCVGYSMSNIKKFATEKCGGSSSCRGIINMPGNDEQLQAAATAPNISLSSDSFVGREQFSDLISGYRSGLENGGEIQESALSPIFDLSEFDMLSAQQALDQAGCFETTLPNQLTIQNHPHLQLQSIQLSNSQVFATSSQLNGTLLLPANERNDDDFLESLLAPFGEDHSLEGSNI
ncbi:hypothetical protein C2S51_038893 [Perilla frutescens var. frutescens]|nr:hypothetical protein C2S51_038893 [Perilla frutescens var. frutescens]